MQRAYYEIPMADWPVVPSRAQSLQWPLRGDLAFLNHGSFGSVPEPIWNAYAAHRRRLEGDPIEWIGRRAEASLRQVAARIGRSVGAPEAEDGAGIGLVTNASSGIGGVLRSLPLPRGARLVTTNHVYNAVRMAMRYRAEECGGTLEEVVLPLAADSPISMEPLLAAIRRDAPPALVVIDHVTSPTAALLDVGPVVAACRERGTRILVDGAHAPGMLPLDLASLGADWYVGNLHKWTCAPKGCGFLYASPGVRRWTHPETISHNLGQGFEREFGWQGTRDLAAWLTIPDALDLWDGIGIDAVRAHNYALCVRGKELLESAWRVQPIQHSAACAMGSMAIISLPDWVGHHWPTPDALMTWLHDEQRVEVPVIDWSGRWHVRISAHVHNRREHYERLAAALAREPLTASGATASRTTAPA